MSKDMLNIMLMHCGVHAHRKKISCESVLPNFQYWKTKRKQKTFILQMSFPGINPPIIKQLDHEKQMGYVKLVKQIDFQISQSMDEDS